MTSAAITRRIDTTIIAQAPTTEIVATPAFVATVAYRLYAVTSEAATVVTYMKSIGIPAKAGFLPTDASQTVTSRRLNAAMSWFDAPNSCHRYTHVPDRTRASVMTIDVTEATCWFLKPTQASPSHSPRVTRMTRKTSWTTVRTMTTNAPNPRAVPNGTPSRPNVATLRRLPTPAANAPAPDSPVVIATAVSERRPRVFSLNIPPPPTGSASVSYSSWRAVPTEPKSACQPEMAPQAIVTNSIGHSGCNAPVAWAGAKPLKASTLKAATSGCVKGAMIAPIALTP